MISTGSLGFISWSLLVALGDDSWLIVAVASCSNRLHCSVLADPNINSRPLKKWHRRSFKWVKQTRIMSIKLMSLTWSQFSSYHGCQAVVTRTSIDHLPKVSPTLFAKYNSKILETKTHLESETSAANLWTRNPPGHPTGFHLQTPKCRC